MGQTIAAESYQERVEALVSAVSGSEFWDIEANTTTEFVKTPHGNLVIRTLNIPAGVVVVGMVHLFQNFNVMTKGRLRMLAPDGYRDIEAPFTDLAKPGAQRAALALEDTTWITISPTTADNVADARSELVVSSYAEYLLAKGGELWLGAS